LKVILSTWDERANRWRSKPATDPGSYGIVCAKHDHKGCMHATDKRKMRDYIFTSTVALRNTIIQSIVFTKETAIIRLVPKESEG
jgi:hypothetical protein